MKTITSFIVSLFILAGTIFAAPTLQETIPETVQFERDYAKFIAEKERQLALAQTTDEKEFILSIPNNAPNVGIQGKVVMPDGSPIPKNTTFTVDFAAFSYTGTQKTDANGVKRFLGGLNGTRISGEWLRADGTFNRFSNFTAPTGSNVLVNVYCVRSPNDAHKQLLASAACVAHPGMKPLEIKLKKGIPVRGKIAYQNGTPATQCKLFIQQSIEPMLGADIPTLQNQFQTFRDVQTDSKGNYEIFLLPGEYAVRDYHEQTTLKVAATDTETTFDWIVPTPVFIDIKKKTSLFGLMKPSYTKCILLDEGKIEYVHSKTHNGLFVIPPATNDRQLYVVNKDIEQGILETITPEMVGKTVQFDLKPISKVMIKLVDVKDNPLVDVRAALQIVVKQGGSTSAVSVDDARTDEQGNAVLRVAPGKHSVTIDVHRESADDKFYSDRIEKELDLAPGKTFDAGTVKVKDIE